MSFEAVFENLDLLDLMDQKHTSSGRANSNQASDASFLFHTVRAVEFHEMKDETSKPT